MLCLVLEFGSCGVLGVGCRDIPVVPITTQVMGFLMLCCGFALCTLSTLVQALGCGDVVGCESFPTASNEKPKRFQVRNGMEEWLLGFTFPYTDEPRSLAAKIMSLNIVPLAL